MVSREARRPATAIALVVALGVLACDDGASRSAPPGTRLRELEDGRVCADQTFYADVDDDGFGVEAEVQPMCVGPTEEVPGYARSSGDCAPDDPTVSPATDEVCGDSYDENCTDADEACPESLEADIVIPDWDCTGTPPQDVIAWAVFDQANEYYEAGACFVFFEGLADEFYVAPRNLRPLPERAERGPFGMCEAVEGCICPSIENWSYDRGRLYALTLDGEAEDCEEIVVHSDGGDDQVVSNACRKFLFQIWYNPNDLSFVARGEAALRRRLARFDHVEIACFEGQPFDDLPFASLMSTPVRFNDAFVGR